MKQNSFMQKVYFWVFLGLFISGITALVVSITPAFYELILGNQILFFSLIIAELALVIALVFAIKKLSAGMATFFFLFYSFLTGLTLSAVLFVYTASSVFMVFFITSGMFLAISIYGFFTKTDLTSLGPILFMGLIGLIIALIVNIFLQSALFDFILAILGVIIFTGLTAYDTQKIKNRSFFKSTSIGERKEAIISALKLYLDFINLFLSLLRLIGNRR
jgi:FtsH-binding integral membrane protein